MPDATPSQPPSNTPASGLSHAERLAALRIIDANANRASEGLRVVEEHCRFVLADRYLTSQCKALRHDLATALAIIPTEQLLAARDTQGDVGTRVTTPQEQSRSSLRDVVGANWQRVEQALRAIEEYGKLLGLNAGQFEQLRYRAYTLAKACEITRTSLDWLSGSRLYVLLDGGVSEQAFIERASVLISAGVHILQLRDKRLDDRTLLARTKLLRQVIDEGDIRNGGPLLIVNDRPDIALLARADGVHLGQDELKLADARSIVGPEMLIGISTHTLEQARQAVFDGANYLGCGPTFPSGTKQFDQLAGLDFLRAVASEISLPAFAIGGITRAHLSQVIATGFTRIAVSGAIATSSSPAEEVKALLAALA